MVKIEGGIRKKIKTKENKKNLVSIITVVKNNKLHLEETIKSILNQKNKNFEYIIIDGNSNDGTLDIIRKYEDKIDYWVSDIDGIEVPTSNTTSVSGSDGEISNMIAPVQIMVGDTLILNYVYFDWVYESDNYSGEMRFVLE